VAAVEAVEDNLSAKVAGNESVDGRMTACDDKIGRRTTTQQPTNKRSAQGWRQLGDGAAAAEAPRQQRGSCGGSVKADVGGSLAAARCWRQLNSATSAAAWRQLGGGAHCDGGSAVAAAHHRDVGCGGGGSSATGDDIEDDDDGDGDGMMGSGATGYNDDDDDDGDG
jgi:hypothetical protein